MIECRNNFREFAAKIRYIPADLSKVPFKGTGDWSIEHAQRNAIAHGLNDAAPDDLIMISDLDEIHAPDIFNRLQENKIDLFAPQAAVPIGDKQVFCPAQLLVPAINYLEVGALVMAQTFHGYYFDWVAPETWQGTIMIRRKNLTIPQALRDQKNQLPRASGGGYHLSYMGGLDRVINKMTSIVDGNELVVQSGGKVIDRAHVEKSMAAGIDVYGRQGSEMQFVPYDAHNINLPHIDEFLKKYPHFLREPQKYFKEA